MDVLTFNLGKSRRGLVSDVQNFNVDFSDSKYSWIQARQYEDQMRQVQVNVVNEDGSPFDLTGCNYVFEGLLPDNTHRIYDATHGVALDPVNGQFRFDFPAPVFAVAGSYKQAFFRIYRNGQNIATLEFCLEVLADKVISGIVPSDYLTPFEDLYAKLGGIIANADGDVKAKLLEWQTQINELITNLNGDYASIQLLVTGLKSQLDDIAQKIKAGNVLTQADLQPFIDEINQQIVVDDSEILGGTISTERQKQLDNFVTTIPDDGFKIGIISDSHYENHYDGSYFGTYEYTKDAYHHLTDFNYLGDKVDVLMADGDNTNGNNPNVANTIAEQADFADKFLSGQGSADRFIMVGNHDDNTAFKYWNYGNNQTVYPVLPNQVVNTAQFKSIYQTDLLLNGETRNDGSLYFYKDYSDAKIRVIGLYTEDVPEDILNSDGSIKYDRYWYHTYSQAQIDWLIGKALVVPDGYQTLIISHAPINGTDQHQYNQDIITGILNAFVSGTAYSGSSVDTVPVELRINASVDFGAQGARTIIATVAGHIHKETLTKLSNWTAVTVTCDANRSADDAAEDVPEAFSVFTINTDTRTVLINGFGRATDRQFSY